VLVTYSNLNAALFVAAFFLVAILFLLLVRTRRFDS
jgi:hypothetical protein